MGEVLEVVTANWVSVTSRTVTPSLVAYAMSDINSIHPPTPSHLQSYNCILVLLGYFCTNRRGEIHIVGGTSFLKRLLSWRNASMPALMAAHTLCCHWK